MLVMAMQACGAVFAKTQGSLAFVSRTLEYLGDNLIAEFVRTFSLPLGCETEQSTDLNWMSRFSRSQNLIVP